MALSNYTELQAAIITHAMRDGDTGFAAAVPDLIALAHSRLNRELRCRDMEDQATVTITSGSGPLPAGYLEFIEVKDAGGRVLAAADPSFADEQFASASAGTAKYFAVMGSDIKTWRASSSSLVLRYYEAIPDFATASTNWLLTKCPGLYLYGSLIEAAAFMMDDGRIPVWGALYDNLKRGLLDEDLRSKWARASVRVKGPTP